MDKEPAQKSWNTLGLVIFLVLLGIVVSILGNSGSDNLTLLFTEPAVGVTFSYPDVYAPLSPRIIPGNEKHIFHRVGRTDLGFELTKVDNVESQPLKRFYETSRAADASSGEIINERVFTQNGTEIMQYTVEAAEIYGRVTTFLSKDKQNIFTFIYFAPPLDGKEYVPEYDEVVKSLSVEK